ncbi:DUF3108 domain-containing protein [Polynucleobacter antarcticus]|uniref:DUF3108 domain-containing protein n=1 Tax=Polynucleobacter antarcticus TaxID=1743162 RepID=A0A6M9PU26_9BURK|nr:DUF3108 domain-containing protein [Polynucleobacter antarcticus]QKM62295.1 hypothetical protein DCO16_03945 [Polynucleobacter antarcticus]
MNKSPLTLRNSLSGVVLVLALVSISSGVSWAQSSGSAKPVAGTSGSGPASSINAQFEYDLKVTVDASKRSAYLARSKEEPSPYESVYKIVSGSMTVATVVDQVKIDSAKYHISSKGTLLAGMSTALGGQNLIRDSVGTMSATGMLTNTYQEKRGNTDLLLAKVEVPKNIVNFYKVSSRTPPVGTAPYTGRLLDMLTVGYQFIGRELPAKSVVLPVTDGRSVKNYTLVRGESLEVPFDGSKIKAVRYYKTTSKDDNATFEIWFSEKGHIPLRSVVGLSDQYGATIQLDLKKMPKF